MLTRLVLLAWCLVVAPPAFAQVEQDSSLVRLIDVPFNAGDFTTNGDKTWTVQQADVQTHAYGAIGKLRFYTLDIINADISAGSTGNQLIIQLPFTVARRATAPAIILNATVRVGDSRCVILVNTSQLLCTLNSIAVFTTSTQGAGVQVQIVLEVP
jgi:hypothetical protein